RGVRRQAGASMRPCRIRAVRFRLSTRHCQSKIYTACSRIKADWSSTVFAHELTTRSAGFDAENRLYLFALTMPIGELSMEVESCCAPRRSAPALWPGGARADGHDDFRGDRP